MLSLLQAVCALSLSSLFQQAGAGPVLHERYAPGHTGAVATESDICSRIGINLLKKGGNAADAVGIRSHQVLTALTLSSSLGPHSA